MPVNEIHPGMPEAEYRAATGAHATALWTLIDRSPAHYRYEQEHPREQTPAMLFGAACHCWMLDRDRFDERFYVAAPCDRRTREGKAAWAAADHYAGERTVISFEDHARMQAMSERVLYNDEARGFLELEGASEVAIFWTDQATGLQCKGRIDRLVKGVQILDLKTCENAKRGPFERHASDYGYWMQLAFYADGLRANGVRPLVPRIIAVEKDPPYEVAVHKIGEAGLDLGRRQYAEALALLARCERSGEWPGYQGEYEINPPAWALRTTIVE